MIPFYCKSIVIYSQDAGGGNVLLAFALEHLVQYEFYYILAPRSEMLFDRCLSGYKKETIDVLGKLDPTTTIILFGTGEYYEKFSDDLKKAKAMGFHTIGWIDHWEHYRERFGYPGAWLDNLPDIIWVSDKYALKSALSEGFPQDRLVQVDNPYYKRVKRVVDILSFQRENVSAKKKILYICEPVSDSAQLIYGKEDYWGFTEFTQMQEFIHCLPRYEAVIDHVIIRLHPNENANASKYDKIVSGYLGPIRITYSKAGDIVDDLVWSDLVVGMESAGLVAGIVCNRTVISCIPKNAKRCSLPHEEIIKIHSFTEMWPLLMRFNEAP